MKTKNIDEIPTGSVNNNKNNIEKKHRGILFSFDHYTMLDIDDTKSFESNKKVTHHNNKGGGDSKFITLMVVIGIVLGVVILLPAVAFMITRSSSRIR